MRTPLMPPPFLAPDVAYVTMCWAFRRLLRHRIRNNGAGGGGGLAAHMGGHGHGNPSRENPCPPSPNQLVPGT